MERFDPQNSLALELLTQLHSTRDEGCPWVFPARTGKGHLVDLRKPLQRALDRDIYQIKDLLGHSSVAVTQQSYAHLQQSTLRTASEVAARTLEETLRVVAGQRSLGPAGRSHTS